MSAFRPADHAMGLELQLEELTEQLERARVQGRDDDARRLENEIGQLQSELAYTAERASLQRPAEDPGPELHDAEKLAAPEDAG